MAKTGIKMAALLCLSLLSIASGGPCGVPNGATLQPASVDEGVDLTDIESFCRDVGGQICDARDSGMDMVICLFTASKATFSYSVCMNYQFTNYTGLVTGMTNPRDSKHTTETFCKGFKILQEGQYWANENLEQPDKCILVDHTGADGSPSEVDCAAEKHFTMCSAVISNI